MPDTTSAAGPNTDKGSKDSDAIRVEALRCASHAQQAQDTLARLEEQLKSCDESISSHRAALVLHKQQLTADKSKRAELTDTLTRQRKDTARAVKQARKADAKYDKALLAQLDDRCQGRRRSQSQARQEDCSSEVLRSRHDREANQRSAQDPKDHRQQERAGRLLTTRERIITPRGWTGDPGLPLGGHGAGQAALAAP